MRITAPLIQSAPQFLNCVCEREISLRGFKIGVIENLGATQDQFDAIDFSDNSIQKLENFPVLNRVRTLLCNNNRIHFIADGLEQYLPLLENLILTNNLLAKLADLEPLAKFPKLQRLSLHGNPVKRQPRYRLYVINKLRHLKSLDFQKIKPTEREEADKIFGVPEEADETETKKDSTTSSGVATRVGTFEPGKAPLTPEQKLTILRLIKAATSNDEINKLQAILEMNHLPADISADLQKSITAEAESEANSDEAKHNGDAPAAPPASKSETEAPKASPKSSENGNGAAPEKDSGDADAEMASTEKEGGDAAAEINGDAEMAANGVEEGGEMDTSS